MAAIDYARVGVDRELADRLVDRIQGIAGKTKSPRVKASIGGYASLYALDSKRWIAASTDGVGTKLKLAFRLGVHDTVGIDLVAMSVNDLLCVGAEPLFFLDYFATSRLELAVAEAVIRGIARGCREAGSALVGGETAELPGFYSPGEYDLAGFAVGAVDPRDALPRRDIRAGDRLIGIASSGFHSNGYSLIREWIPDGQAGDALAREALEPTRIYARAAKKLIGKPWLKGLAHITGSGFLNVPRLSDRVSYELELPGASEIAPVFRVLEGKGLPLEELASTFNLGVGMVAIVEMGKAKEALRLLRASGERAWELGAVSKRGERCVVRVLRAGEEATLPYS